MATGDPNGDDHIAPDDPRPPVVDDAPADQREWDERYRGDADQHLWSGEANGTLVVEATDLPPGAALDVGCGEGGDAIWLAGRGWRVTALDPSAVALDRARAGAAAADVRVEWVHAGLAEMPHGRTFDLVSAQYPALRRTDDGVAQAALADAVAPGGTLLFVHHDDHDHDADAHADEDCDHPGGHGHEGGGATDHDFDPDDYVMPRDMAAYLAEHEPGAWVVEVSEVRPRPGRLSPEARHVADIVFRARRAS